MAAAMTITREFAESKWSSNLTQAEKNRRLYDSKFDVKYLDKANFYLGKAEVYKELIKMMED